MYLYTYIYIYIYMHPTQGDIALAYLVRCHPPGADPSGTTPT